jgi:hypothetical protein
MKLVQGIQLYFTTRLMFPHDKDEWVKQEPIPTRTTMGVMHFVECMKLPDELKSRLCRDLEASWKDARGVWIQIKIEATRRNRKWGNAFQASQLIK